MYTKRREFIRPSLLSLYLQNIVINIPDLMLCRRPLFDRADHLRVFRVGPEQITGLITLNLWPGGNIYLSPTCSAFSLISLSLLAISILSTSSRYSFSVSVRPAPRYPSSAEMMLKCSDPKWFWWFHYWPISRASSPSWRYLMSSAAIRESR